MADYYSDKLSAERLRRVYGLASPRVRQYLDAEVAFVVEHIESSERVLELGCGCGRVLPALCDAAGYVVGIDTAVTSLQMAAEMQLGREHLWLVQMDAVQMGFADGVFDRVVCIQNGISAFHVDPKRLMSEAVRVTKPGGTVMFSSYAEAFWPVRLAWFEAQAAAGLLGEIDSAQTGNGQIVCRDGFTASTFSPKDFRELIASLSLQAEIVEVDQSSVFCVLTRPDATSGHEPTR